MRAKEFLSCDRFMPPIANYLPFGNPAFRMWPLGPSCFDGIRTRITPKTGHPDRLNDEAMLRIRCWKGGSVQATEVQGPRLDHRSTSPQFDILPRLKAGDSYAGQLNEALRFGGFPLHGRPRCDRFAPVSVLRRLHGRLATPRVPRRRGCSVRRSNHGRAVCRIAGIPIRVCPTVSVRRGVRIGSRSGCWDTSGRCV